MKSNDRVTAYIRTNAIGTKIPISLIGKPKTSRYFRISYPPISAYICRNSIRVKVPVSIIGKPKTPRCFRILYPSRSLLCQRTVWLYSVTFRGCFSTVFFPFKPHFASGCVAVMTDNCGLHEKDLTGPRKHVSVFTSSPRSTSPHQHMDMEIIVASKSRYRGIMLHTIVRDLETRAIRRDQCSEVQRGMRGFAERYDYHLLDVSQVVPKSRKSTSNLTIRRFWVKSRVFPFAYEAGVNAQFERTVNKLTTEYVK